MSGTGVTAVPVLRPAHPRRVFLQREDLRMRSYSTVMTDHPGWIQDGSTLIRVLPAGGHALARTDGRTVTWCCPQAAVSAPRPGVFPPPESAARDVPELAGPLSSLGTVARFANPSLWDALGTAVIRQVVRAAQARAQYRALCEPTARPSVRTRGRLAVPVPRDGAQPSGTPSSPPQGWRSSGTLCELPLPPTSTGASGRTCLPRCTGPPLQAVRRIGPWTAGAAVADCTNDFTVYPYGDLAVRTWAARAAPPAAWPGDEQGSAGAGGRPPGRTWPHLTLLTLAWGGQHAG